jgi:hypothetical protein
MSKVVPQYPPPAPHASPSVTGVVSSAGLVGGTGARRWTFSRLNLLAAGTCAALLLAFAVLGYSAVLTKSATFDEPLHAAVGQVIRHHGDYRMDPEDGALFLRWGNLPHGADSLRIDTIDPEFVQQRDQHDHQWWFIMRTLYHTGGSDADTYLNRSRFMFVIVGLALGAVAWAWSWKLAGPVAAIVTVALYCLDPNFLAHSPLVKNDVPMSLLLLAFAFAVWSAGRRVRWWTFPLLGVICGAAMATKFSGLLVGPLIVLLLGIRAFLREPWPVLKWNLDRWLPRLGAAMAISVGTGLIAYVVVWASYGFRYLPTPDPNYQLDIAHQDLVARRNEIRASDEGAMPSTQEAAQHKPATLVRLAVWADAHRLMPQAWSFGLVYTYATTLIRSSFLVGSYSNYGWWYYFPAAMLFKTPTATLAAVLLVLVTQIAIAAEARMQGGARPQRDAAGQRQRIDAWTALCLFIPPAVYMLSAMAANLNLGLRHVLPVYPFIFIAISIGLVRVLARWRKLGGVICGVLALGLLVESLLQYPDYLAFFNAASGGSRGGRELLSDSNLDWGQDLKALGEWQRTHSDRPLYLNYFGTADPGYYRIQRRDLIGGWLYSQKDWVPQIPANQRAYVALSATSLQGTYFPESLRHAYRDAFWEREPREVLGGSIYIYDWPLNNQPR